jgi:hypothetical protein
MSRPVAVLAAADCCTLFTSPRSLGVELCGSRLFGPEAPPRCARPLQRNSLQSAPSPSTCHGQGDARPHGSHLPVIHLGARELQNSGLMVRTA